MPGPAAIWGADLRRLAPRRLIAGFAAGAGLMLLMLLLAACAAPERLPSAARIVLTPPAQPAPAPTLSPSPAPQPSRPPNPALIPTVAPDHALDAFAVYPTSPFVQLSGGEDAFCGLQQDGRVLCWGDPSKLYVAETIQNGLAFETFRAIANGRGYLCGIRSDNTVKCVGNYGDTWKRPVPRGEFQAVSAGEDHTCALDLPGAAVCWGRNADARTIPPDGRLFTEIFAGSAHSCGLDRNRELHCWGGRFTDGAAVPPGPYDALALGRNNVCARRGNGAVQCWGNDADGQLRPPADVVFTQISLGERHGCGIDAAGMAQCWGDAAAAGGVPPGRFTAVSAGWYDTCGLRPEGYAECWGASDWVLPDYPPLPGLSATVAEAFGGREFAEPVDLFTWPDGTTAVVERKGSISAYTAGGMERLILDLTAQTSLAENEFGMLSAALDPEFDRFPFLYVYYHRKPGSDGGGEQVVARLARFPIVDGVAMVQDELALLELSERTGDHQGGAIRFGPDGMLYLGLGDNKKDENAASLATLNGKIIRIDVRNATAEQPYRIPDDNPFAATPGARPEIWAYGLRNPWRMSFDRQGRLWVGDVGDNSFEELSLVSAGTDLGWPVFEGSLCVADGPVCESSAAVAPVAEYGHTVGCAIVGAVARSRYENAVIYGDLCTGRVWALTADPDAGWQTRQILYTSYLILSLNADADGNVYLLQAYRPILRLEWQP